MIGYYRERGLLREIDGNRPVEEVTSQMFDLFGRSAVGLMAAVLKTPGEIELMDQANRIVHQVLDAVGERIAPGGQDRASSTVSPSASSATREGSRPS